MPSGSANVSFTVSSSGVSTPLIASAARVGVYVSAALWISHRPGFELHQLWLLSVATVALQLVLVMLLLRREMRIRLDGMATAAA